MGIRLKNVDEIIKSDGTPWAPAGGSGGSVEMVATGTLANGDVVSLRSDGTVEKTAGTAATTYTTSVGSRVVFKNDTVYATSATFDSNTNKVVIAYQDVKNANRGTAVVGTVSGGGISFGTPVVFESGNTDYISATFDSNSNKVVIAYQDHGNNEYGTAVVGAISGTSITFGTPVVFENAQTQYISATFDSNSNKVVIAYKDWGNSHRGTAVVGTVSGTSITFETPVVFEIGNSTYISATFDSNTNKVVIAYEDGGNSGRGTAVVGTVSGNSITFGTPVVFQSDQIYYTSATFDSSTNRVVIAYSNNGNSARGTAVVGGVSGDTIIFGSPVVFDSAGTQQISATFDSNTNKVVIAYKGTSGYGVACIGAVSGSSITFETPTVYESANAQYLSATFDSNSNKVVIPYANHGNAGVGTAAVFQAGGFVGNTNADNWMGIYDGASGTVKITGGVAEGLTGLTPRDTYYVSYDGTLTNTELAGLPNGTYGKIGRALSSTTLLITHGN